MYLKRLELQGFKSFADKTIVNFEEGITGIVGPNGSGKSNISDSIRWVLGEQSAKTLRGGKMEDIIFAGAANRRPLGYAEITLVLDNKDGAMQIDYSEVNITRRVFRSGESEYYINKTSCRLKDIKELFMDTGIGTDGYSIIGQGRIDDILSSRSEDRRNLFEEAAGIVKYKARKKESEKKLEKTRDNLTRISDILTELENQIDPLKNQSEKAKEYLILAEDLKNLEVNLFIREIDRLKEQIKHFVMQKELINKQLNYNDKKKYELENKYNEVKKQIEALDSSLDEIQKLKYDTQNSIEKKEGELKVTNEKVIFLHKEMDRIDSEIKELDEMTKKICEESTKIKNCEDEVNERLYALNKELNDKNKLLDNLINALAKEERNIEEKKSDTIQFLNLIAEKKSKINTILSFNKNIEKRIGQLQKEIDVLISNVRKKNNEIDSVNKEIVLTKEQLFSLRNQVEEKKAYRKKIAEKFDNAINETNNLKGEIQGKISRYNLLKDMKEEYEGFYKSVRNALKACNEKKWLGKGVKGVVAELITADKKYETAIEVALGATLQNIVTETEEDAKTIIQYLKEKKLGRVTFLPMTSIYSRELNNKEKRILGTKGLIGVASELINFDKEYISIFNYLLGRVLIVNDINVGIKVAKLCNHSLKIVSLDGDVLNSGGSMTGGSFHNKNTKLLGRGRQIIELENDIYNLKEKYSLFSNRIEELRIESADLDSKIKSIEDEMNLLNLELVKLDNKQLKGIEDKDNLNKEIIKTRQEKEQLLKENIDSNENIEMLERDLVEHKKQSGVTQDNINNMVNYLAKEKEKKNLLEKEITEIKVEVASCQQEIKSIRSNLIKYKEDKERILHEKENKKKVHEKNTIDINNLVSSFEELKKQKIELNELLSKYETSLTEIKNNKTIFMETFYIEQENLKEINMKINELQKSLNTLEVKQTKYNMQLDNFNNKLWEDYEMTYQMALKYEYEIDNVTKVQNVIRELKKKIKNLGNINVSSIEEYEHVEERFRFLNEQKNDLLKAKDSLNKVIKDMEVKMKDQFMNNFSEIKVNFGEIFIKLFGGGKADIYLEDEENILTTGIEIIAQPPGKKLQNISLLSGGEKALTAIALLFAILKLKPSPFCILDEIEAALDDANVYRFADYLKEFSNKTQFIVITHRKGTMESVDSLYGVTMEEDGVSKLVSVKLSDKVIEKAS